MYKLKNGGVVRVVETERDVKMYKEIGYEVIEENYSPENPADSPDKKKGGKGTEPPKGA